MGGDEKLIIYFAWPSHTPGLQVRNEFYKDTQGAILVYDVTNRASFEALSEWLIEMRTHLSKPQDLDSIVFVVCANKVYEVI